MAKASKDQTGILLETGTNELEIVEFSIGTEYYGINVAKVREIIRLSAPIVPIPDANPSVSGVINLRGKVVPVVNLGKHLNMDVSLDHKASRIIIAEFNRITVGFWVSTVTRIHRLSWQQVESPSGLVKSKAGYAVGVIKLQEKLFSSSTLKKLLRLSIPNQVFRMSAKRTFPRLRFLSTVLRKEF